MKILFLLCLIVFAKCQLSTITASATHATTGCQIASISYPSNFATFANTSSFPVCPDYVSEPGISLPGEMVVCVVSSNTLSLNFLETSTYNLKLLSEFTTVNTYSIYFDTSYGMNNVSMVAAERGVNLWTSCYNDTTQTISVFGPNTCFGVPSLLNYFTYCEYELIQTTFDGFSYMRSLKTSINFYTFAYFLPGVFNTSQMNFVFTSI
jgi:hypothetical protein